METVEKMGFHSTFRICNVGDSGSEYSESKFLREWGRCNIFYAYIFIIKN
jgi:hypothetical protein